MVLHALEVRELRHGVRFQFCPALPAGIVRMRLEVAVGAAVEPRPQTGPRRLVRGTPEILVGRRGRRAVLGVERRVVVRLPHAHDADLLVRARLLRMHGGCLVAVLPGSATRLALCRRGVLGRLLNRQATSSCSSCVFPRGAAGFPVHGRRVFTESLRGDVPPLLVGGVEPRGVAAVRGVEGLLPVVYAAAAHPVLGAAEQVHERAAVEPTCRED
mmetsp:Transcript_14545/g.41542  ORF Transcript_14545/g.41542 Transcript_14545/m.41542 type:complete len:215 (+) Transcript_14545:710-1354(+)